MSQRDDGLQFIFFFIKIKSAERGGLIIDDLTEPDAAEPEGVDGEEHVLNAGSGSLMVFHFAVHGLFFKHHGDAGRTVSHDVRIFGAFGQFFVPGIVLSDDHETPRLVVQPARSPSSGFENRS